MSKNMKVGDSMNGDKYFDFVLPRFVLCLRDFFLELEANGRQITPDDYLEDCLKSKQVKCQEDEKYNRPREYIKQYFPRRRVFTFDRPGGKKVMTRLESVHDDELSEDFVEDTVKFTSYIFQCEPKRLLNRKPVSGRMLANLARQYVKAMREGSVPCVDDAMTTMAKIENEKLVKRAVSDFEEKMKGIQFPVRSSKQLQAVINDNQMSLLRTLVKALVFDDEEKAHTSAKKQMDDIASSIYQKNDQLLQELCMQKLERLYKPLAKKVSNNRYNISGGYQIYKKDVSELEKNYSEQLSNVDQALRLAVLVTFRDKTKEHQEAVLESDQQMTKQERERELNERKQNEVRMLKYTQDLRLELEQQKRNHDESIRQIVEEQKEKEEAKIQKTIDEFIKARRQQDETIKSLRAEINELRKPKPSEGSKNKKKEGTCLIL